MIAQSIELFFSPLNTLRRITPSTDTLRRYADLCCLHFYSRFTNIVNQFLSSPTIIFQYDKCREDYELNHKGQDKVLMRELNKYLVRPRKK